MRILPSGPEENMSRLWQLLRILLPILGPRENLENAARCGILVVVVLVIATIGEVFGIRSRCSLVETPIAVFLTLALKYLADYAHAQTR